MNIYLVNRHSNYKGPFEIIDSHREHIIEVGDICLRDSKEGVEFLVVCSSDNSWQACKKVGIGDNSKLSDQGNTLLFSFDGLHKRKGNIPLMKLLSDCYREKVIINFLNNAIDILEYKIDLWDVSLFRQFFASSQELISRSEPKNPSAVQIVKHYPSEFAKYLDEELLGILKAGLDTGNGLKKMYQFLREKEPVLFRTALMKFLEKNPTGTIYDKPTFTEIPSKSKVEPITEVQVPIQKEKPQVTVTTEYDQSYLLSGFNNNEFKKLLNQYRKGNKNAFDLLVKENLKLVTILAREYQFHSVDYKDLVQEGTFGLMEAIERFNPNRKVQFPFYAKWWINHFFVKAINRMQTIVKIPENQIRLYNKVRKSIEQYEQEHEYKPSISEIDIEEDINSEHLAFLSSLPDSLDKITTRINDWDELPSTASADDLLIKKERTRYVYAILSHLKKREAYILKHLYGIGEKRKSTTDIAELIGLSRERVRQIAEKAIMKLRDLLVFKKIDVDPSSFQNNDKTDIDAYYQAVKKRKDEANDRINNSEIQDLSRENYSSTKSILQHEVNEKGNIRVNDDIYYDNHYCTVKKIIENGKFSKLIIENLDGIQDYVPFDESRYKKVISLKRPNPSNNHINHNNTPSLCSSTSLNELVNLHIITRKQLKHCHKRNLKTIGDVEQIIELYQLTHDSTRFTQYTLDIYFSIVDLVNPQNKTLEKVREYKDNIKHENAIIPHVDSNPEAEVPVKETIEDSVHEEVRQPIDTDTLYSVFEKKATSYKYFWMMAIISIAKEKDYLTIPFKDITIRMAALAWPIVFENDIDLGSRDMMKKYLSEVLKKTTLINEASGKVVEQYLTQHYSSQGIDKILAPLLKNVPYRFLSPWIKYISDDDVIAKSNDRNFNGLYALQQDCIILDEEWWDYIKQNYSKVCDFAIQSFIEYTKQYNSELKLLKLMTTEWAL